MTCERNGLASYSAVLATQRNWNGGPAWQQLLSFAESRSSAPSRTSSRVIIVLSSRETEHFCAEEDRAACCMDVGGRSRSQPLASLGLYGAAALESARSPRARCAGCHMHKSMQRGCWARARRVSGRKLLATAGRRCVDSRDGRWLDVTDTHRALPALAAALLCARASLLPWCSFSRSRPFSYGGVRHQQQPDGAATMKLRVMGAGRFGEKAIAVSGLRSHDG